jgi:hypothetical protein
MPGKSIIRLLGLLLSLVLVCTIFVGTWLSSDRKSSIDECVASVDNPMSKRQPLASLGCAKLAREAALKHDHRAYRFLARRSEMSGDLVAARRHWETAIKLGDNRANIALLSLISNDSSASTCKRIREALTSFRADTENERITKYETASFVMDRGCPFSEEERREALGPNWNSAIGL